jgi:hypothetical protein
MPHPYLKLPMATEPQRRSSASQLLKPAAERAGDFGIFSLLRREFTISSLII